MDIIPGIITEKDFTAMGDRSIILMGRLLDGVLGNMLKRYLSSEDSDKECKDRLESLIGADIKRVTICQDLIDAGIVAEFREISPSKLSIMTVDLDMLIDHLTYVRENASSLSSQLNPRTREDYVAFMRSVKASYPALLPKLKANKNLFYAPHEQAQNTGVGILLSRSTQVEIVLKGAEYLRYCIKNQVPVERRRNF